MGPGQALAPGDGTGEGCLVFSSGLMVPFHRRPSTGGFRCALPEGIGSPGAGLSQTKPVGKSSESRFKAVSTEGVSLWCCGCHEGVYGRRWGLSEAFQRRGRGSVPAQRCWGGGLWTARTLFSMEPRDRGRKRSYPGWSCCPEPGSESRFRIPPEPGAAAWWGEISWLPDHPGGPQVFWGLGLGISARKSQRPEPQ